MSFATDSAIRTAVLLEDRTKAAAALLALSAALVQLFPLNPAPFAVTVDEERRNAWAALLEVQIAMRNALDIDASGECSERNIRTLRILADHLAARPTLRQALLQAADKLNEWAFDGELETEPPAG